MAMVYLATDSRLHRAVAIKVMHPHLAEDMEFRSRFEQEARSAAGLAHPNLVGVLDQGEEHGTVYLIMEYLPGITLRELLKQQQILTTEQAIEISEALLSGLAAAHNADIIHRDLKPENVLLADDGRIKLGDFGLARAASANTTAGQALLGTIAYLSPELVTRGEADKQSDIYAFGIMLFEMLTGEQPFTGEQPMQIAYQHAHDPMPSPSSLNPASPPRLDALVAWVTQKDPEDRPADAGQLLQALQGKAPIGGASTQVNETRVLATDSLTTQLPKTTVLGSGAAMVQSPPLPEATQKEQPRPARTPSNIERAQRSELRRSRRGLALFLVTLMLAILAGGLSWWFGHGPGSQVVVPSVTGLETAVAEEELLELTLLAEVSQCSHLTIPPGHITSVSPEPGTRVDRNSTVQLCESTGPEMLQVPPLVGMNIEEAKQTIVDAGFTFGEVVAERFTEDQAGIVLAALTPEGEGLDETYPEQSVINLIATAGAVPDVLGMGIDEAQDALSQVGLSVADDLNAAEYSDDFKKDVVLGVSIHTDPLSKGDAVGLVLSLGPELFEVPKIEGMTVQQALEALTEAGFDPKPPWFLRDEALETAKATGSNPTAGEMRERGTRVDVRASIFN